MKQQVSKILFAFSMAAIIVRCYPAGPDYVEDLDLVYTTHDESYDFKAQNTYALPDKIVKDIKIDNGDTTFVYMKDTYAKPILDAIDANMSALGWSKVDISAQPDVLVTPGAITSTNYYYSYWYDWWYGGWYGGWGWYYPPYYTVSSYTTGTLIITMADPNSDSAIEQSPATWVAALNGLLTGSYSTSRVLELIDQAFAQSPYLKTN